MSQPLALAAAAPAVLYRATFKDPNAMQRQEAAPSAEAEEVIINFVELGEYVTIEFMSDGTARVVTLDFLDINDPSLLHV